MKFLEIEIKFQALGFYHTLFKVSKSACYCFMDAGKRHETLGSKTEDFIFQEHSKAWASCPPSHEGVILSSSGGCGWVCVAAKEYWSWGGHCYYSKPVLAPEGDITSFLKVATNTNLIWLIAQDRRNCVGILDTLSKNLQRCPQPMGLPLPKTFCENTTFGYPGASEGLTKYLLNQIN